MKAWEEKGKGKGGRRKKRKGGKGEGGKRREEGTSVGNLADDTGNIQAEHSRKRYLCKAQIGLLPTAADLTCGTEERGKEG